MFWKTIVPVVLKFHKTPIIYWKNKAAFGFAESSPESDLNQTKSKILNELKKAFKPEFLNRIDDTIVFNKLTKPQIQEIAGKMLNNLAARLEKLQITIEFSDTAVTAISDVGFDDVYGARPLRRAIQNQIEDKISEKLLNGEFVAGNKILCTYQDNDFVFEKL